MRGGHRTQGSAATNALVRPFLTGCSCGTALEFGLRRFSTS